MCTLTWAHARGGYHLAFNRDELRTRQPGLPPTAFETNGCAALAPRDADEGGTWIAVNELGVTLALQNAYLEGETGRDYRTRGEIIPPLCDAAGAAEVMTRLADAELAPYRGFVLTAIDADGDAQVRRWDGRRLSAELESATARFLTSSSYEGGAVRARRRALYDRKLAAGELASPAQRLAFHASRDEARDAYSVCMERPDARTVSLTEIEVTEREVRVRYAAGPPSETELAGPWVLARRSG